MNRSIAQKYILFALFLFSLWGCRKNLTDYHQDPNAPNLAIFSNTGNNLLTCLVNGQPWKTVNRTIGGGLSGLGFTNEIVIQKLVTNSTTDTLIITWFADYNLNQRNIGLMLPVPKNFQRKDFAALQGKRIQIDSSNGVFFYSDSRSYPFNNTGRGTIYFNKASIDSTALAGISGIFSGLIEADLPGTSIRSGRFDHTIDGSQLHGF